VTEAHDTDDANEQWRAARDHSGGGANPVGGLC
jgi:hypothetical protein